MYTINIYRYTSQPRDQVKVFASKARKQSRIIRFKRNLWKILENISAKMVVKTHIHVQSVYMY